jgi:hypothetical protein
LKFSVAQAATAAGQLVAGVCSTTRTLSLR